MTPSDCRFLLLTSKLGDPSRNPLTTAQLRTLALRVPLLDVSSPDSEMTLQHLSAIGLDTGISKRILSLLEDQLQLESYIKKAAKLGCFPIVRTNPDYPLILRKRLGNDAPGCLWIKGNPDILKKSAVSVIGSRDLLLPNRKFAKEAGIQAARQGYAVVSGNARGADIAAQNACLEADGFVISVVADSLAEHNACERVLYVAEDDFDQPFSAQRALHRNRTIHALGEIVFVAQCTLGRGGTWDGSIHNLKNQWSPLYCFSDNSAAAAELEQRGASQVSISDLSDFRKLTQKQLRFL